MEILMIFGIVCGPMLVISLVCLYLGHRPARRF
jgi:hypothetical protein